MVDLTYGFDAVVVPTDAGRPIPYEWTPTLGSGQSAARAGYSWSAAGSYDIHIIVNNCGGSGMDSDGRSITITAGLLHVPSLAGVAQRQQFLGIRLEEGLLLQVGLAEADDPGVY